MAEKIKCENCPVPPQCESPYADGECWISPKWARIILAAGGPGAVEALLTNNLDNALRNQPIDNDNTNTLQ